MMGILVLATEEGEVVPEVALDGDSTTFLPRTENALGECARCGDWTGVGGPELKGAAVLEKKG